MDIGWIIRYAGCERGTGCMGPPAGWWLFGVPLYLYPYMILFALIFSFPFLLSRRTLEGMLRKKRDGPFQWKKNLRKVLLVFLIIMIIEIILANLFMLTGVY